MHLPASSLRQISQAFFNLYNQNKFEIGNLFETIKTCLSGIVTYSDYYKYIMPNPNHFSDDRVIASIGDLYYAAQENADLAGKVLYIRWYYHMTLFAMGSLGVKKAVECIQNKTGEAVKVRLLGYNFINILDCAIKFSIRQVDGSRPWNNMYSGFGLYSPLWDDILDSYIHGGEESLIRLEMPGAFEAFTENSTSTYWEDYVPLTDLGKQVKEHFIDEIKQVIANK